MRRKIFFYLFLVAFSLVLINFVGADCGLTFGCEITVNAGENVAGGWSARAEVSSCDETCTIAHEKGYTCNLIKSGLGYYLNCYGAEHGEWTGSTGYKASPVNYYSTVCTNINYACHGYPPFPTKAFVNVGVKVEKIGTNWVMTSTGRDNCVWDNCPDFDIVSCTLPGACVDNDGDGYGINCCPGADCDDGNPNINPGKTEICGDGIDNDCQNGDESCISDEVCNGKDDDGDGKIDEGGGALCGDPALWGCCNGWCTGIVSNDNNCGDCGISCGVNEVCEDKTCVILPGVPISNCQELQDIMNEPARDYYLVNDINCYGFDFYPIASFEGTLDGRGYKILDLSMQLKTYYQGLFQGISSGGIVKDLGLESFYSNPRLHSGTIASSNFGLIENVYATGTIDSCDSCSGTSGGLVASNYGTIKNSYASVNVGTNKRVGGFAGVLEEGIIENCYSTGLVEDSWENANQDGGFIGDLGFQQSGGTCTNCYWDTQTSGKTSDECAIGKTTSEMKSLGTFNSWDFCNSGGEIWAIRESSPITYPCLSFEKTGCDCRYGDDLKIPISNCQEFQAIRDLPNKDYYLVNDIDCSDTVNWNSGKGFLPIGSDSFTGRFSGSLDGRGFNVYGIYSSNSEGFTSFIIDDISTIGKVQDIGFKDVDLNGGYVSVINNNYGRIERVYATGEIEHVGLSGTLSGFVNQNYGVVQDSYSIADIRATIDSIARGGLVSTNRAGAVVENSYYSGTISPGTNIGGLVRSNSGTCTNSYWNTEVSGTATSACGTGKTTTQMKTLLTFNSWDFCNSGGNVWAIIPGSSFPCLDWEMATCGCPFTPGTSECGDGIQDPGEECDLGDGNTGTPCVPYYGEECSYCTLGCLSVTLDGGSCGDDVCQETFENEATCPEDCGESLPDAYWANSAGNYIESINVVPGTTELLLFWKNTGLISGTSVTFEVYEADTFPNADDEILVGSEALTGIVDSGGNVQTSWVPSSDELARSGDANKFYFKVNGGIETSNELEMIISVINPCSNVSRCVDYGDSEGSCIIDTCNVSAVSVNVNNPEVQCGLVENISDCIIETTSCSCEWNSDESVCGPAWGVLSQDDCGDSEKITGGNCFYDESTLDSCDDDNFLDYSWEGIWSWYNETDKFSYDPNDSNYVQDGEFWYYDPDGDSLACLSGSNIVPCPQQVKLPFFGLFGFFMSFVLIGIIYFVFRKQDL